MTPKIQGRAPTFWLNTTTSYHWKRSPVGIVRVEQEINKQLRLMLGDRLQTIVLQDGDFFRESSVQDSPVNEADFWPEPSYGSAADPFDPIQRYAVGETTGPSADSRIPKFGYGDVLITLGLDWEYPGLHDKIRALKKQHGLIVITCCYDLIPVLFPHYCVGDVASWFKNYLIDMTWLSDGVLCISENTRRDYEGFSKGIGLPARSTEVIKLGSALPPRKAGDETTPQVEELLANRFFLFVSTIERRKNHDILYRAYHLIRQDRPDADLPKLVFVGMQGWGVEGLMSDIRLDPLLKDDIVVLPHVSDSELSMLYERCEAFLYPSLYEGWGLPVAEALELGRPVLASNAGSIPEVGGDLVRYIDPWSPREWASELLKIIDGELDLASWSTRISQSFKPYEWSSAAETLVDLAIRLRDARPAKTIIEPGYDLSSMNGIHYGDKLIYEGKAGIIAHGPYLGLPKGKHLASVELEWFDGESGHLQIIARHDAGKAKAATKRLAIEKIKPGKHCIELGLQLPEDVDDLEFVCEVHSEKRVKFSIDRIVLAADRGASSDPDRGVAPVRIDA